MDQPTLKALLKEAKANLSKARKAFNKSDNYDDMKDEEFWSTVVDGWSK